MRFFAPRNRVLEEGQPHNYWEPRGPWSREAININMPMGRLFPSTNAIQVQSSAHGMTCQLSHHLSHKGGERVADARLVLPAVLSAICSSRWMHPKAIIDTVAVARNVTRQRLVSRVL